MRLALTIATALTLAACGSADDGATPPDDAGAVATNDAMTPAAIGDAQDAAPGWNLQSSAEGVALGLTGSDGKASIRLFCPSGKKQLLVNVPAFQPIGSEERLSFGSGGEAAALVADTAGDAQRGGVSGTGALPDDLAALVAAPLSASYGAQSSGPHPAPPADLARAFVAACGGAAPTASAPPAPATPEPTAAAAASGDPCMMQGSQRLTVAPRRATGTEPFWSAQIQGRCVTYSHPDDQDGTRVWTRYAKGAGGETWSGALAGGRFELRIRPQRGCSDGMSDRSYPFAAELIVNGETRKGCAAGG